MRQPSSGRASRPGRPVMMLAGAGLALVVSSGLALAGPPAADTVLLNGKLLVFHGIEKRNDPESDGRAGRTPFSRTELAQPERPQQELVLPEFAQAAAIASGRIVFVGSSQKARNHVGPATKVIDLGGRMVMPGIIDGHFHGTRLTDCHMGYAGGTVPQILAELQACLERPDQLALKNTNTRMEANYFFAEAIEPVGTPLTRQDLDRLDTTRPILIEHADGHKFWMNSKAIANARIDAKTPDPPEGAIGRGADRVPNGFFSDYEVPDWGPTAPVTEAMRLDLVARTNADANRAGITSVFIPGDGEEEIARWAALQQQGKITLRANIGLSAPWVRGNADAEDLRRRIAALDDYKKYAHGLIAVSSVKIYCDGVMEYPAQTAAMLAPYRINAGTADRPDWRPGRSRGPDPSCADARPGFVALDKAGWQIHVHSMGDRATRDTLDNFEAARAANGDRDLRHTITHLEAIDPADVPRFGRLGVIASMSLHWPRRDAYSVTGTKGYIDDELYDHLYPAADLWRTGAVIAGGSDYPVDPLLPFVQIETALTHTGESIPGVFPGALSPREVIPDLLAAIRMHTINSAYEMHQEKNSGSIEVGKEADLIVLNQDLFQVPVERISDTRVLMTLLGGRVVYDAGVIGPPPATAGLDIVIKGGTVYDGSGGEPVRADVGIVGDKVAVVGDLGGATGRTVIDATGLAVSPGFVNMMSGDEALRVDGRSMSDILQGVTIEIMGEGESMGPLTEDMRRRVLEAQGDLQYPIAWKTLHEGMLDLQSRGVSTNFASFIGASTLREYAVGFENKPPTAAQLESMKRLVVEEMEAGALGIASALIYAPGFYAGTEELIALCQVAAQHKGIYISHMRSEGDHLVEAVEELIRISREAQIPAEIYHLKASGQSNWGKIRRVVGMIEQARKSGQRITADMYSYAAAGTGLDATMPPWAEEGGYDALFDRLKDPGQREKIAAAMRTPGDTWENLGLAAGSWDRLLLVDFKSAALKPLTGKTLGEVARTRGTSPEDTIMDLVREDRSRIGTIYFLMNEDNVRNQLKLPWVSLASDAGSLAAEGVFLKSSAHPRAYGSFARFLGKYVRDQKVATLQEGIRRLTSLPATNLGLDHRGLLKPGMFADVVVFDPATIADKATFEKPHQYAVGVKQVIVNGVPVIRDGRHTGAKPGRALWGPGRIGP